jgi:transposase
MALRVVSLRQLKLEVLLEPGRTGDSVAEVCRRRGISRETFYLYRRRYEAEGVSGLDPRPRTPVQPSGRIEPELEAVICRLRNQHPKWGARRIRSELERAGTATPAISTIHQVLKRNQLVAPRPPRRPRADRRFERPFANDLWQIDATRVLLRSGEPAWILDCLDDHARYLLSALACQGPTGEAAWRCFLQASASYGLPRQLLSDNHTSFTGRLFGTTVMFERRLARGRADQRPSLASADARQARALPPHAQGLALRRARCLRRARAAGAAGSLPCPRQRGAPAPGHRRRHAGRALPLADRRAPRRA